MSKIRKNVDGAFITEEVFNRAGIVSGNYLKTGKIGPLGKTDVDGEDASISKAAEVTFHADAVAFVDVTQVPSLMLSLGLTWVAQVPQVLG